MKKIIAIMLSAIMLLGVMSTLAFAEDSILPWELEDFGQQSWTLYLNEDNAPVVDGVIGEDEYALAIEDLDIINDIEDDRFFTVDHPAELCFDFYLDYDGDYIYFGAILEDPQFGVEGGRHPDDRIALFIGGDKNNLMLDNLMRINLDVGVASAQGTDNYTTSVDGNKVTYEATIDKYTILDKYGFDELDQIYLRIVVSDITEESLTNSALSNELWFAFMTRSLVDILPAHTSGNNQYRYPHVIYFVNEPEETEAPETEAPATGAPETEAPAGETEAPAGETEAPATDAPETEAPVEGGCGASVAAIGVALVATFGVCTVFISKKR